MAAVVFFPTKHERLRAAVMTERPQPPTPSEAALLAKERLSDVQLSWADSLPIRASNEGNFRYPMLGPIITFDDDICFQQDPFPYRRPAQSTQSLRLAQTPSL